MVRRVPRVARGRERQVEARAAKGELVRGELAQHDRAGPAQARDRVRVGPRHVVAQDFGVARGRQPGHVDDVLDADGNAVERAADTPGGDLPLGGARRVQRPLGIEVDEGAQRRVEPFDAREQRPRHLDRRHVTPGDGASRLGRAQPVKLAHSPVPARIGGQGSAAGSAGQWIAFVMASA